MDKETLLNAGYILTSNLVPKKSGLFLWAEFMHGDADHYDQQSFDVDSIEELEAVNVFLQWMEKLPYGRKDDYWLVRDYEKLENEFYSVVGEEWRSKHLWDGILDWWPCDVTYDDNRARIQKVWLVFMDETGHEFKVKKL